MGRRLITAGLTLLVASGSAGVAYASFREDSANTVQATAATMALRDDDGANAMFALTGLKPSDPAESRCLTVTYEGNAAAAVRLYGSSSGGLAPHLRLKVERGSRSSGSAPSCSDFTPDSADYTGGGPGVVYDGSLASYPDGYAAGVRDAPGVAAPWSDGETHAYRLTVRLESAEAAQGQSAQAAFTWESR